MGEPTWEEGGKFCVGGEWLWLVEFSINPPRRQHSAGSASEMLGKAATEVNLRSGSGVWDSSCGQSRANKISLVH